MMSDFVQPTKIADWTEFTKGPCVLEGCGSSDAASIFRDEAIDGLRYKCFSCGKHSRKDDNPTDAEGPEEDTNVERVLVADNAKVKFPTWEDKGWCSAKEWRGISPRVMKKFKVEENSRGPEKVLSFPYRNVDGAVAFSKMRGTLTKDFMAVGKGGEALFGQSLFPVDSGRSITIFEGEADALAAYQVLGEKFACVSIKNGATAALKDCQKAFEYLNGFKQIIVCFDNDEEGRKATDAVCGLFGRKAAVFEHAIDKKDACDYLVAGATVDFVSRWWKPKTYVPDGIRNILDIVGAIEEQAEPPLMPFPHPAVNRVLKGIFKKRMYLVTAGTGTGKSTFTRGLAYEVWKQIPSAKIGLMFLEESAKDTVTHLIGKHTGKAAHQPDILWEPGERQKAAMELAEGGRFEVWDHFDALDSKTVLKRMEYMVKVLGCDFIFLDHLSTIVAGSKEDNERKELDQLLTELRHFVEGTEITMFTVCHLTRDSKAPHENGGEIRLAALRGSGSLGQVPDVIIAMERDQQTEDPEMQGVVTIRVLKNRPTGTLGIAGYSKYYIDKDILVPYYPDSGEIAL
jgi:twinkle protein